MIQPLTVDKNLLKSVSRSFYTSLFILPPSVRPVMSLAYLLCRTADTIADTEIIPVSDRLSVLSEFRHLFDSFPIENISTDQFQKKILSSFAIPTTAEGRLLHELSNGFAIFNSFSRTDQAIIQEVVRGVTDGMTLDLQTFGFTADKLKALNNEAELERYLQLIGGEPGRFWIRICLEHFSQLKVPNRAEWIHRGIQFGMGLQLINILRDLPRDLKNGRCYIPETLLKSANLEPKDLLDLQNTAQFIPLYHQLINEALIYLQNGLSTLTEIPIFWYRSRAAIWWPLILGLRTLAKLRVNPEPLSPEVIVKISRKEVYTEMAWSVLKLPSKRLLLVDFNYWKERASAQI